MLGKNEIEEIIPQRDPFLMIDEVENFIPGESAVCYKNVSEDEWYFKGHFPGNPIMPGVLITESLAQAGAIAILSMDENKGKNALFGGIDKMKFKKMIFVLAIATFVIFAGMLGSTYAYYTLSNGTTVNVTTGVLDDGFSVVFTKSEFINLYTGVPIAAGNVDSLASATEFTITPDSTKLSGYDIVVNIGFANVNIDSALKVADFKYDLSCNGTVIASGNGTNINSDSVNIGILSTSDNSFDISKTYSCKVRLWLQDSGVSQNELMNKKFSGYVKVSSVYRK